MAKKTMPNDVLPAPVGEPEFLLSVEDFVIELSTSDRRVELINAFARLNANIEPLQRTRSQWVAALTDFSNAPA